jgi:F-type H+-transporting ATPase subunit alpha
MTELKRAFVDERMENVAAEALSALRLSLVDLEPKVVRSLVGRVAAVADGVVTVHGLHEVFAGELLEIGDVVAVAQELREDEVRAVLLGRSDGIGADQTVRRTKRVLDVPCGPQLLGRIVDPLGRPLDTRGPLLSPYRALVDRDQTPLSAREPVSRPLQTGIFVLDAMIPIGLGQRQLIIGDQSTGKTEMGLDILVAMDPNLVGVYVAIGRRGSATAGHLAWLRSHGFFERGFAVVSEADYPVGLIHLTPYAAMAMAEDLAERGRDVVVVIDDLTTHADAHRSVALLLGRPVGREAHPADIFYAHARVLERGTQLGRGRGGGSLTTLPIVETQLGDLTGYIPTNLVSITDGQIRLDAQLVAANVLPAVDVQLSVSRVGGKAQPPLIQKLSGTLKNRYAQFLELESFARFGTRLEATAASVVHWGRRVRRALTQDRGDARSWTETVARLVVVMHPRFAELREDELEPTLDAIVDAFGNYRPSDAATPSNATLSEELEQVLRDGARPTQELLDHLHTAAEHSLGAALEDEMASS